MRLNWNANASVSALHAAYACWRMPHRVIDPEVTQIMGSHAQRVGSWIAETFPTQQAGWDSLIAISIPAPDESAPRSQGVVSVPAPIAECLQEIQAAFERLFPRYLAEAPLRLRPLQEQWLGFGRGLLMQWQRGTGIPAASDACLVIGVQPVLGGYGRTYPDQNTVTIEALLTNTRPELPEVVRLAWLLVQPSAVSMRAKDRSPEPQREYLHPLATIPAVLGAAEAMDLTRCGPSEVSLALETWAPEIPDAIRTLPHLATELYSWWQDARQLGTPWDQALRTLAHQLEGGLDRS